MRVRRRRHNHQFREGSGGLLPQSSLPLVERCRRATFGGTEFSGGHSRQLEPLQNLAPRYRTSTSLSHLNLSKQEFDPVIDSSYHRPQDVLRRTVTAWEQRRIVPGLELAVVKASFSDPPEIRAQNPGDFDVEHMWLSEVEFDGRQIQGTLINSPQSLKSFHDGDRVTITGRQLFDWMYVIESNVYGGFTVDLMRSRMAKGERTQHDKAWGFNFGEVGTVPLVPPEFIGDPPLKKKGLFSVFGGSRSTPQDYAKVAATEHPMSVNMRESLDQTLTRSPQMVRQTDSRGYNLLHQLSLAGSRDGVDICLKHGADSRATAPNGMTPHALAKCLGWKKVMERLQQAGAS